MQTSMGLNATMRVSAPQQMVQPQGFCSSDNVETMRCSKFAQQASCTRPRASPAGGQHVLLSQLHPLLQQQAAAGQEAPECLRLLIILQ